MLFLFKSEKKMLTLSASLVDSQGTRLLLAWVSGFFWGCKGPISWHFYMSQI